jgi:hypothetical protein
VSFDDGEGYTNYDGISPSFPENYEATHLFEELGTLEGVVQLATKWFS